MQILVFTCFSLLVGLKVDYIDRNRLEDSESVLQVIASLVWRSRSIYVRTGSQESLYSVTPLYLEYSRLFDSLGRWNQSLDPSCKHKLYYVHTDAELVYVRTLDITMQVSSSTSACFCMYSALSLDAELVCYCLPSYLLSSFGVIRIHWPRIRLNMHRKRLHRMCIEGGKKEAATMLR